VKPNFTKHSNLLDFKGTEDEFYKDFFPDTDRSEQALLTKSGKDESLKTTGLDFTDPFASLGTIESFFDADKPEKQQINQSLKQIVTLELQWVKMKTSP
jgi:hypothetical protein